MMGHNKRILHTDPEVVLIREVAAKLQISSNTELSRILVELKKRLTL